MSATVDLIALSRHMEWADATTWESVVRSEAGRHDQRILTLIHHIHTVQQAFLQLWREETPRLREAAEFSTVVELSQWGREGHAACQAFLATTTPETLARVIRAPWAAEIERTLKRPIHDPTLAQTVTQIAMHSTHHRGQINMRLRELGGEPVISDFIAWVWFGQPAASWTFLDSAVLQR